MPLRASATLITSIRTLVEKFKSDRIPLVGVQGFSETFDTFDVGQQVLEHATVHPGAPFSLKRLLTDRASIVLDKFVLMQEDKES